MLDGYITLGPTESIDLTYTDNESVTVSIQRDFEGGAQLDHVAGLILSFLQAAGFNYIKTVDLVTDGGYTFTSDA